MSNSWTSDKLRITFAPRTLCAWVSLGLSVLPVLTGCSSTAPQTHSGDPLFGEYYPKGPNGQPMPPPPAPTKTSALVLPYPSTNTGSTTAALASNSSLPGGRPLAINENNGTTWALTNNTATNSGAPTGAPIVQPVPRDTSGGQTASVPAVQQVALGNNGAPIKAAVPMTPVSNGNTPGPIIAAGSWSTDDRGPVSPMGTTTIQSQEDTLKGRGATGLQQKPVAGGVLVSCYVPQRTNPASFRYLETVAADYGSALRALLQQIDQ